MAMAKSGMDAPRRVLIANRGEIALRIQRSAALFPRPGTPDVSFECLSIYTQAEKDAAHVQSVDPERRIQLQGTGIRAYLDVEAVIAAANQNRAWGVAPGYGFMSESSTFAKRVEESGLVWIGPTPDQLALLSDKLAAKRLARECGVPTLESTQGEAASVDEVQSFFKSIDGDIIIKALSGGGGRGMRIVRAAEGGGSLADAYASCAREAKASFGDERLYAERFLGSARHVEIQVIGDGTGDVAHAWERECSIQRRHQKLIEIAPSPSLAGHASLRDAIISAALKMAGHVNLRSLSTFEFLVLPDTQQFYFMEVNPRIQVEHTITEQITGLDLVAIQLQLATGIRLKDIGLGKHAASPSPPRLASIQCRINAERFMSNGSVVPTSGTLAALNLPSGPGIRIDTAAHAPLPDGTAYQQTVLFDSLMLKAIFTAPSYRLAVQMADAGLSALAVGGVETNVTFIQALLRSDAVRRNEDVHTRYVEERFDEIFAFAEKIYEGRRSRGQTTVSGRAGEAHLAGPAEAPTGTQPVNSPLSGLLVELNVKEGDVVRAGQQIALLESMKMEHLIRADKDGTVRKIAATVGLTLNEGEPVCFVKVDREQNGNGAAAEAEEEQEDVDVLRADLQQVLERRSLSADESRSEAVARRRAAGYLTARENIALLVDSGSFIEWGDLQFAAQRTRVDEDELRQKTSNDGVITGWATINAESADHGRNARSAVCIYDYMVLAGTQGHFHHLKLDRLFRSVLENPAPIVLYAEGGGGRPGDVDLVNMKVAGLDTPSFALLAAIRARGYPSIGVANGYTFAGNAALLGTCDIVVATEGGALGAAKRGSTSTGMGGPAMIEGGGLGKVKPQDVGPVGTHYVNGDYDVVVPTEKEAASTVKTLLSLFQGPSRSSAYTQDVKSLRRLLPKQRTRAYDVRKVISTLVDDETFVELGQGWGHSIVTGLARVDGQTVGVLASAVLSPLGGAIDAPSAAKASRLITMLHRTRAGHLIVLCDTPGFMVGPPAEKQGGLRIFAQFFADMMAFQDGGDGGRVFAVTLRKAYGLGAQAMLGGSSLANFYSVAWPQGEFAGMGIEGAVRLGMRKELEAVKEGKEREELFTSLVDMMYERGKAHNMAALAEIDTVIDPAETRRWLVNGLRFTRARTPTWQGDRRPHSSHL